MLERPGADIEKPVLVKNLLNCGMYKSQDFHSIPVAIFQVFVFDTVCHFYL